MARKVQAKLEADQRRSVTLAATNSTKLQTLTAIVDAALADLPKDIVVTEEIKEVVLFRMWNGESLASVCRWLNIPRVAIQQHAYNNPEFAEQLELARAQAQYAKSDLLEEIPYDETLSIERARLLSENLKFNMKTLNRGQFGDKLAVDARVQQVPVVLPEKSIDGDGV